MITATRTHESTHRAEVMETFVTLVMTHYLASNLKNSPEEFGCSFATVYKCRYYEV